MLAGFNISFGDYEQTSKDSINSVVSVFASGILSSNQVNEVEKIYDSYTQRSFINDTNKGLLDIAHSLVLTNKHLSEIDTKRNLKTENSYYEQKNGKKLLSLGWDYERQLQRVFTGLEYKTLEENYLYQCVHPILPTHSYMTMHPKGLQIRKKFETTLTQIIDKIYE